MSRIYPIVLMLALLGFAAVAPGCTVYDVAMEERNPSDWYDDKEISFKIEKGFLEDDEVKYLDFDAYSYLGKVYIVGEYDSRGQVDRAVAIAKGVTGVRSVTTYMLPKREHDYCGTTDAIDISARFKKELVADKNIWSTNIDYEVIQCNLVILGLVGSSDEISRTIAHAKAVPGVRNVKSYLAVHK